MIIFATFLIIFLKHSLKAAAVDRILDWRSFYETYCLLRSFHDLFSQPLSCLLKFSFVLPSPIPDILYLTPKRPDNLFQRTQLQSLTKRIQERCRYAMKCREELLSWGISPLDSLSFCCLHLGGYGEGTFPATGCKDRRESTDYWQTNSASCFGSSLLTMSLMFWKCNRIPCFVGWESNCMLREKGAIVFSTRNEKLLLMGSRLLPRSQCI